MNTEKLVTLQSRQDVSTYIEQAAANKTPLCVYRTSAPSGGQRLDLSELNKLIEIDADNLVATAEPGLTMGELAAALTEKGLRFLPADTPYYRHLTIGEWVYHGCPNPSSWKYRLGKHALMGSTYILPSGKLIKTGGKTVKNVTGYDFTRFLAGAYSDIGIGVEFLLKLLPQPEYRLQFLVGFPSLQHIFGFIDDLRQNPLAPAFLMAADAKAGNLLLGLDDKIPFFLELELDGVQQEVEAFAKKVRLWAKKSHAVSLAENNPQETPFPLKFGNIFASQTAYTVCDEWKIPYDKQCTTLHELKTKYNEIGWFGQWAEGKVHAAFTGEQSEAAAKIAKITNHVINSGGVSSGVYDRQQGRIPAGPLRPLEIALRQRIDPQGIFTPKEVLV
ncbi:hypothetical protein SDC9_15128 [bioreactor metagenome]|uniref:FAD-binding PCMH-type domain-containing protein n=1 Tax=bioreactor metagenome TaxID=1076179 RepID=A0A644TQX1_9ZZZZ|nr:FAD-binding oxidoreductase [Negativicutes bacterium]